MVGQRREGEAPAEPRAAISVASTQFLARQEPRAAISVASAQFLARQEPRPPILSPPFVENLLSFFPTSPDRDCRMLHSPVGGRRGHARPLPSGQGRGR